MRNCIFVQKPLGMLPLASRAAFENQKAVVFYQAVSGVFSSNPTSVVLGVMSGAKLPGARTDDFVA
jgi:hypothetical protein